MATGLGFDEDFLGFPVALPIANGKVADDLAEADGSSLFHYTHFILTMSISRRLARWVAWNIDGLRFVPSDSLSREKLDFRVDPRLPGGQIDNNLYRKNPLDRGHIARRADLLWGRLKEAQRANEDSFYYTNITPQMDSFNQSKRGGVWGLLENALLDQSKLDRRRVSVMGGPVLRGDDRTYRDCKFPREFWKAIAYALDDEPRVRAFLLTQQLSDLEAVDIDLDEFETFEQSFEELTARTSLDFGSLGELQVVTDAFRLSEAERPPVRSLHDIVW